MVVRETARLRLRWFEQSDLDPLAAIHADPEVNRYVGGPTRWSGRGASERLAEYLAEYRQHGFSKWAVVLKETGELLGRCGPVVESIDGVAEVELGCTLGRRYWGAGFATEAMSAALEHCFQTIRQTRIVSLVDPANVASKRLMARVGMTLEREVDWHAGRYQLFVKVCP